MSDSSWHDFLAVVAGQKHAPGSNFIGFTGPLTEKQQSDLWTALRLNSCSCCGIRLKGQTRISSCFGFIASRIFCKIFIFHFISACLQTAS